MLYHGLNFIHSTPIYIIICLLPLYANTGQ